MPVIQTLGLLTLKALICNGFGNAIEDILLFRIFIGYIIKGEYLFVSEANLLEERVVLDNYYIILDGVFSNQSLVPILLFFLR